MDTRAYSSSYAASGEDQIRHYMEARHLHLGYLVAHDARIRDNGRVLLAPSTDSNTVVEILIDVRPQMPEKRRVRRAPTKGDAAEAAD